MGEMQLTAEQLKVLLDCPCQRPFLDIFYIVLSCFLPVSLQAQAVLCSEACSCSAAIAPSIYALTQMLQCNTQGGVRDCWK